MEKGEKVKVLLAKVGLDSHDRGLLVVASALKDAGMEVILVGLQQTPTQLAEVAIEEDVDVVGLSSLADSHCVLVPRVINELKARGGRQAVILGGFIRPEDIPFLKEQGVAETFSSGSKLDDIVQFVREAVSKS